MSRLNGTTLPETATNVMLLCSAVGEPQDYYFSKWIQYAPDGLTKVSEYESSHIKNGNAFLAFESVSYMNSGIYHCFVSNGIEDFKTGNIVATNSTSQIVKGNCACAVSLLFFLYSIFNTICIYIQISINVFA